ncbi:non-homologous end-joining DNA ligase [Actinomadura sp. 9N407]|uniref:non-homologous end-joining DNA ligase n=1 Tax=Actinomadura sp. 9N407 TaxID=3375154 RepID=UPI0037A2C506
MGLLPTYRPMLAVAGELPAGPWAAEMKWDGIRAVAYLNEGRLRLLSRNDRDITPAWPELAGLAGALDRPTVLDGEIVGFRAGRPSFEALQHRMHVRSPARIEAFAAANPVTYIVFDVLHTGRKPQIDRPYGERRDLLLDLGLSAPRWDTPPSYEDLAYAFTESGRLGMEGIVAKRLDSRYRPGRRDRCWTKVKNIRTQEVVVIGWTSGAGRRAGGIGALLLAVHAPSGPLTFAGHVGTGFTDTMLRDLSEKLTPLERDVPPAPVPAPDARNAHWVEPKLVGEVAYAEWTGDGRLRHPTWRGIRPDKSPGDVHPEEA